MDAAEEQPGAEAASQQEADREVEGAAASPPQEEALQPRQKRHLSRSLDLSRGSVSSRAAKHQKQGEAASALQHAVASRRCICMHGFTTL